MARRATSLGPKPSLFVIVVFFLVFLFFVMFFGFFELQKKPFFPLERAFFVYFQCFSFFLP